MKQVTKVIKVYQFSELSESAKETAIQKWYEDEDYPFLSDDLMDLLKDTLSTKKITANELTHYYSLSNCQGDGYCFIGQLYWKNLSIKITHSSRYYYAGSVDFEFYSQITGEDVYHSKNAIAFKNIYKEICKEQEKTGYNTLEYRMNFEEFSEHCEANDYNFDINGNMLNL